MDKNSVIGLVLMGLVLFGFTFFNSKQMSKQREIQRQLDSAARVEALAKAALDSAYAAEHPEIAAAEEAVIAENSDSVQQSSYYKDAMLNEAHDAAESFVALENERVRIEFTTKGAQPYSAHVKDYYNFDSTELYIFKPGQSEYSVNLYTGESINTADFVFRIVSQSVNEIVMALPLASGASIEQRYVLDDDSYMLHNTLSFKAIDGVVPRNVSSVDIDYSMTLPRMEKGYKNESQYSKLDYYFDGDKKISEIGRGRNGSKRVDSRLSWFAFQQQFFSAIFRSADEYDSGELSVNFASQDDPERNLMTCTARMRKELKRGVNGDAVMDFDMYFGPNHYKSLKSYDQSYEKIIPLGGKVVGLFTKFVIIPMFDFLHRFFSNFGIIILLMTIIIKLVVLPLTYKSYKSSAVMNILKPEIEKINAKYPKQEDAMKKQQATMALYKQAGASPMGGCLPMLLTFPILWAMFRFFPASIELRQQPFLWCNDLSTYDSIVDFGSRVPLLGDHLSLFALLMAVTMWFYTKLTMGGQASNDPNAASMKFMSQWMMPIMMFFICNSLSAALSYYYLLSNLITMLETFVIRKWIVKPDKVYAAIKANEGKPQQKSKWQQRLEQAQKMQQAQLREQQKKQGRR